jgi:hypothetical protein
MEIDGKYQDFMTKLWGIRKLLNENCAFAWKFDRNLDNCEHRFKDELKYSSLELTNSDWMLSKSPVLVLAGKTVLFMKYLSLRLLISCPSRNQ